MEHQSFLFATGIVFTVVTLLHLTRLAIGIDVVVGGIAVPVSASYLGIMVSGIFAYFAFQLSGK